MKSKKVTLINIIALLGYALLGFFTFMGAMFFSGGAYGTSIAIALGVVVVLSLVLSSAIYCKRIETDFDKWKKLEIALVVVFALCAIYPARYVIHCFEVIADKEQIKQAASEDVEAINKMFNDYEAFEYQALGTTQTGLESAFGQPADNATMSYIGHTAEIESDADIESWIARQRDIVTGTQGPDGVSYVQYKYNVDSIVNGWHSKISSFNVMFVATHIDDLSQLVKDVATKLTDKSACAKLPTIEFYDGLYTISCTNQVQTVTAPKLQTSQITDEFEGSNPLYYIIYLVIILLIFLDYLMANRSTKLRLHNDSNDTTLGGGIRLGGNRIHNDSNR